MQTFLHSFAFAGFLYAWMFYMYNRKYEFAMFADKFSGFGDRLGESVKRKSGYRIKWNLGWVMMGVLTLTYLVVAIIIVSELVKWLPHPVLLWIIPLISGCVYFFRDLAPLKKRSNNKAVLLLKIFLIVAVVSGWYIHPTWWTYNTVAFIVGLTTIRVMSPMKLKYVLVGLAAIILYDIYGVFLSGRIVEVVKTTVEVSRFIPPVVVLTPNSNNMLGLADIVFPGVVVVSMFKHQLAIVTYIGFGLGLGLTYLVLFATGRPLPAMLFIAPMTVLLPLAVSKIKKIKLAW